MVIFDANKEVQTPPASIKLEQQNLPFVVLIPCILLPSTTISVAPKLALNCAPLFLAALM